jgi:hypothetical protein
VEASRRVSARPWIEGRITLVQEQRFRLTTDGSQSFLFSLAQDAPLDGVVDGPRDWSVPRQVRAALQAVWGLSAEDT